MKRCLYNLGDAYRAMTETFPPNNLDRSECKWPYKGHLHYEKRHSGGSSSGATPLCELHLKIHKLELEADGWFVTHDYEEKCEYCQGTGKIKVYIDEQ